MDNARIVYLEVSKDASELHLIEQMCLDRWQPDLNDANCSRNPGKLILAKPKKRRVEVGLTEHDANLIRGMAATEGKTFAEMLAEIIRLGITVKISALLEALEQESRD